MNQWCTDLRLKMMKHRISKKIIQETTCHQYKWRWLSVFKWGISSRPLLRPIVMVATDSLSVLILFNTHSPLLHRHWHVPKPEAWLSAEILPSSYWGRLKQDQLKGSLDAACHYNWLKENVCAYFASLRELSK